MSIDDKLQAYRRQIEEEIRPDTQRNIKATLVAGVLSAFPIGGAAIQSLLDGRAQRNVYLRFLDMLTEMGQRLKEIKHSIPDEEYFCSDEFQSLLALAIEQLQTTHDENKRKMLAAALANSGSQEFANDACKEQFVRILRDLSVQDLTTLKNPSLNGWTPFVYEINYGPEVLSSLSRLEGFGLVIQQFKPPSGAFGRTGSPQVELQTAIQEVLTKPPNRFYHISSFAERFLKFIGSDNKSDTTLFDPSTG